ncbi:hypothetical protein B0H11DRAFT_1018728 [Mycena galericulata]|nr:hypothetical protein B0H11DRAFT_1018728 [Mycena galericulata]
MEYQSIISLQLPWPSAVPMHKPLILAFLLSLTLPLISAVPVEESLSLSTPPPSTPTAAVAPASSQPDKDDVSTVPSKVNPTSSNQTHKPTTGTTKHQPVSTPRPIPTHPIVPSHPVGGTPAAAPSHFHPHPPPSSLPQQRQQHPQSVVAIVFEVLGALAGFLLLLSLLRCLYSYKRTPRRDRIAAVLHRHQLQREMEELERNPPVRRHSIPPPPPYLAPPVYPEDENTPLSRHPSTPYAADGPESPSALPPNG